MAEDWLALNRANWDERVPVHLASRGYDLMALRAGRCRLDVLTEAMLPPLAGLRVLHLQCHFGRDTLVLAGRGAEMTGVDFSPLAIIAAQDLAAEMGLPAHFVLADVYGAPAALPEPASFDLVFTAWGTICWLPDVAAWARVAAGFLRPGGRLLFLDSHPAALVFDDLVLGGNGRPGWFLPYFGGVPLVYDEPTDYADPAARLRNERQVNWLHPLGAVLAGLRDAEMRLDTLQEHRRVAWQMFCCLVQDGDGLWTWPDRPWLPLSLGLEAIRDC
ncbi:MAG TPA: class I SAM-dependent methyltransferase [Acetobacteraceae bacterium]